MGLEKKREKEAMMKQKFEIEIELEDKITPWKAERILEILNNNMDNRYSRTNVVEEIE